MSSVLSKGCKTLTITDTTGAYDATTNPTGWGALNTEGSEITVANITITYGDGSTQIEDVLSQIPDNVTGSFTFTGITLSGYIDGTTVITYDSSDGSIDFISEIQQIWTCNVRACIDKIWVEVACKTCQGNCDLGSIIDDANLAEGLYKSLCSGASCCDTSCTDKILNSITELCEWGDCNC